MLDDSRATIGMALLTLGYDVNTTDPAQLEEAKNKLAPYINPSQAALDYAQANQPNLYNDYINSPITNVPPKPSPTATSSRT